jgi:hypothetical protein
MGRSARHWQLGVKHHPQQQDAAPCALDPLKVALHTAAESAAIVKDFDTVAGVRQGQQMNGRQHLHQQLRQWPRLHQHQPWMQRLQLQMCAANLLGAAAWLWMVMPLVADSVR